MQLTHTFKHFPSWPEFRSAFAAIKPGPISAHSVYGAGREDFWDADSLSELYAALWGVAKRAENLTVTIENVLPTEPADSSSH